VPKQDTTSTYGMEVKVLTPRTLPVTSRLRPLECNIWGQCRCTTLLGVFNCVSRPQSIELRGMSGPRTCIWTTGTQLLSPNTGGYCS